PFPRALPRSASFAPTVRPLHCAATAILARVRKEADMKIGFIGLGHMGSGMALNLLKAGHELTVYNRTAVKSQPLVQAGARAAAGKLFICAGGSPSVIDACQPLLDAIGQSTFRVGDKPQLANLVKLSGNFLFAALIESLGEAIALIGKAGIDRREYLGFLTS